jgi:tetrahydromethanopterin S-methyltransferase subunit G
MTNSITPIIIKQGEYGNIHTSLEEVNEKIAKALSVNACYFNKQ